MRIESIKYAGRGKGVRKPAEEAINRRDGYVRGYTWGDCRKLETFQSHVDWTDLRTPEAALAAPTGETENPKSMVLSMKCLYVRMLGCCDPEGSIGWLAAGDIPKPL